MVRLEHEERRDLPEERVSWDLLDPLDLLEILDPL